MLTYDIVVKIPEVESTMRLSASLEGDNSQLAAEIAELLRLNLRLRDNIGAMEDRRRNRSPRPRPQIFY